MANKARNYGLPTVESINEVIFGGANYPQTHTLDRRSVNIAIARAILPYPEKIENYTNYDAANDVAKELRRAGFKNIDVKWSLVYDKNVKFKVVRPPYGRNIFVAVGEKQKRKK